MQKLHTLSHILRPLEEWKQMTSSYQKQEDIQDFLLRAPVHTDEGKLNTLAQIPVFHEMRMFRNSLFLQKLYFSELYLLSYKREPPTNRFEKQQLKTLKADQPPSKTIEVTAT